MQSIPKIVLIEDIFVASNQTCERFGGHVDISDHFSTQNSAKVDVISFDLKRLSLRRWLFLFK